MQSTSRSQNQPIREQRAAFRKGNNPALLFADLVDDSPLPNIFSETASGFRAGVEKNIFVY